MTDPEKDLPAADPDAAKLAVMGQLSLFIDVLLIGGCLYLLVSDIMQAVSGTPAFETRGGAFLVNLSATFALLHRSMALWKRYAVRSAGPGPARIKVWLIVVLLALPLLSASAVELLVQRAHRAQLDALAGSIATTTAAALASDGEVRASHLQNLRGPYLQKLTVRTDNATFSLVAQVPWFGEQGFTAHYSSTQRNWHLDASGSQPPASLSFDDQGPTLVCAFAESQLNCEGD
jgi:hypothetical protein